MERCYKLSDRVECRGVAWRVCVRVRAAMRWDEKQPRATYRATSPYRPSESLLASLTATDGTRPVPAPMACARRGCVFQGGER